MVKNLLASTGDTGDIISAPGSGMDPGVVNGSMNIYCSSRDWKIPRTEEPDRLQFMWSQRVRHN